MLEDVVVAVLWFATANLLRRWAAHRTDAAKQSALLAIGSLAVAFTIFIKPLQRLVDRYALFGAANSSYLFGHCFALLSGFGFQRLVIYLVNVDDPTQAKSRSRRRLWIFGASIAAMVNLYSASPGLRRNLNMVQRDDHRLLYWYMAVFLSYGAWSLIDIVRRTYQFASVTPDRWTRRSIHWMSAGTLMGYGYFAYKGVYLPQIAFGAKLSVAFEARMVAAFTFAYASAPTVASLMPPIGGRWSKRRRLRRIAQSTKAIEPLWMLVTSVHSGAILHVDAEAQKQPAFLLGRRMTEISDSLAALATRFDPSVAQSAGRRRFGVLWRPSPDTVDAMIISDAVQSAAAGSPPPEDTTTLAGQSRGLPWMLAVANRLPRNTAVRPTARVTRRILARPRSLPMSSPRRLSSSASPPASQFEPMWLGMGLYRWSPLPLRRLR
ncbi:MAB_1171c family putative transporter [Catenulispora sp. GAS73]|uniref:MAB_1171c family putative transporter n=1 Tax=Catenulispora sp. GAS73 TaxID=3156269 RepID=UPI003511136E